MNWEKFYIDVVCDNLVFLSALIYLPLEFFFPFNKSFKILREGFWQDLLWSSTNEFISTYAYSFIKKFFFVSLIPIANAIIASDTNSLSLPQIVIENKILLFIDMLLILDFLTWLTHYTDHRFKILWRNHILHHTSEKLDGMAGLRGHWLDNIYMEIIPMLPLLFFKIPSSWFYTLAFIQTNLNFIQHSNINFPHFRIFRYIPGPQYHRWHHARVMKFKYGQNFGIYTTLFDRIFGTYFHYTEAPEEYGVKDLTYPQHISKRFFYPLFWKFFSKNNLS